MGKTIAVKKAKAPKKSARRVLLTTQVVRGIAELKPSPSRVVTLTVPKFNTMVKSSHVGLSVWSSALRMPRTTLVKRIEKNTAFDALEADRLLTVEQVFKRGMEVFEDKDDLNEWLVEKHAMLQNQRPMDLLGSTAGIGLVMMELGRIEHGIY